MINILRNRFKFNHKIGIFIGTDRKSENEILNIIDKFDWKNQLCLGGYDCFVKSLREESNEQQ